MDRHWVAKNRVWIAAVEDYLLSELSVNKSRPCRNSGFTIKKLSQQHRGLTQNIGTRWRQLRFEPVNRCKPAADARLSFNPECHT
jgi:hypothetical protein